MVQILRVPRAGDQQGREIADAIDMLTKGKMQQVQTRNRQKQAEAGLESLPGFTPEMAQALSNLDPQVLGKILPGIQQQQRENAFSQSFQQQQANPAAQSMMQGGLQGQPQNQQQGPSLMPEGFPAPRNSREALELGKIALKQKEVSQKTSAKEEQLVRAETKPVYDAITKEAKVATHNDKRLGRLEELAIHGKLGSPIVNSALHTLSKGLFGVGIDLSALRTADAQEFEKLSSEFVKDAKEIFGGRLTDADLNAFFKTLPTLSQSREGMLRIITSMKSANSAAKLRKSALDEIIVENNGKRPANLDMLVEEKVGPQMDELLKGFAVPQIQRELLGSETLGDIASSFGITY